MGAKARVCFQSNGYWAATDWSKEADRAVGFVALLRPRAGAGRRLQRATAKSAGPARQPATPASTRSDSRGSAQAGAEPWSLTIMTAAPWLRPARRAARWRHRARALPPRRRCSIRVVDARLIHVQVGPDAVLERVEVLELDHQDRPVGDDLVGEPSALARPRKLSAVRRAFFVSSSSDWGPASRIARVRSREPRPRAARRTRAPRRGRLQDAGRPSPRRRSRAP